MHLKCMGSVTVSYKFSYKAVSIWWTCS